MTVRKKPSSHRRDEAPTPAFMKIEGRLARPLPADENDARARKFWFVQPWIIVAVVVAIIAALMIPGLLMELRRAF